VKIQILSSILINGVWHEPGVGSYDPVFARQLIDMGVAVEVHTKIIEPEVKKARRPKKSSGASQPGQVSRKKIAKKSEDTAK